MAILTSRWDTAEFLDSRRRLNIAWLVSASGFWVPTRGPYGGKMPVVSVFFGIVIRMYHDEHPPPHFHAAYQGFEAFVRIEDGEIVHGALPHKAARLVRQWALDHREALTGGVVKICCGWK